MDKTVMTEEQIKHMVDRCLTWRLPCDFAPDGGINFEPEYRGFGGEIQVREPVGTNLLTAVQAEAMVRHMFDGLPRQTSSAPGGAEQQLAADILAELVRARTKFPGKNVTFAALIEEVGELATATFEEGRDRVRKEAVQVAVMAMRMVLDGDHTFDEWRKDNGLDSLVATSEA